MSTCILRAWRRKASVFPSWRIEFIWWRSMHQGKFPSTTIMTIHKRHKFCTPFLPCLSATFVPQNHRARSRSVPKYLVYVQFYTIFSLSTRPATLYYLYCSIKFKKNTLVGSMYMCMNAYIRAPVSLRNDDVENFIKIRDENFKYIAESCYKGYAYM